MREFGYSAEGGAEFVHGAAPVTRAVMREAGLTLQRRGSTRWTTRSEALSAGEPSSSDWNRFYRALEAIAVDLPIAEFLETHFPGPKYDRLRRSVTRTVEGYDAADPHRASALAIRDEWTARDDGEHGRIAGGPSAPTAHLDAEERRHRAALHLRAAVAAM